MTRTPLRLAIAPLCILLAGLAARVDAQVPLPALEARVTDLTGTLTAAQQSSLEEKLAALEGRKGAQVALLILPTTQPEDIAQFGVRLLEAWKLGRAGVDDGAALIVAKDDRALRIEVQYGLEGVLTDATCSRIINDTIVPLFKQGDFYGGINAGIDQMLRVIDGEPLPEPDRAWKGEPSRAPWELLLFALVFVGGVVTRIFGRLGGATVLGLIGGVVGWSTTTLWWVALGGFVALFLLGLIFGTVGRHGARRGRVFRDTRRDIRRGAGAGPAGWGGIDWSAAGRGAGGSTGGGSRGGGWSGGGGRGGGGGASGRW